MKIEEAIENLKEMIELHEDNCLITTEDDFESIKILLDLCNQYSDENIRQTTIKRVHEVIEKDYVSKDKIKEKIKEINKQKEKILHEIDFKAFYRFSDLKDFEINILKELLEE